MNLFYEDYPKAVEIDGESYQIVTDFRDYISLMDMLEDDYVSLQEKIQLVMEYFPGRKPNDLQAAVNALADFVMLRELPVCGPANGGDEEMAAEEKKKNVYSFSVDYPCILAAFLQDYGIDLQKIGHLHWWKFRMLFDNLSEDTEIRKRIYYRALDLNDVKDKEERKRIAKIKRIIQLPEESLSDFDIGDAFSV